MISPLNADFLDFVNSRLDRVGQSLKGNSEYQQEQGNLERHTQELQAALSSEQAVTLQDIDESNLAILNLYEYNCYVRGFKDALRILLAE